MLFMLHMSASLGSFSHPLCIESIFQAVLRLSYTAAQSACRLHIMVAGVSVVRFGFVWIKWKPFSVRIDL